MNKIISTFLCIFLCLGVARAQRTICLETKAETIGIGKTIPVRNIKETKDGITVTYRFNNIVLYDDPLYTGASTIKIDGFWPNCQVGEPAVLSRWDTFVVPNTGAKIIVSDSSYVEFPLELSPARPVLSNSGNDTYTKDNVLPIFNYRGSFPSHLISSTRNDCYRGQQLLDVCITPVQYDYANKKVRVFTMIKYNIQYNATLLKKSLSRFSKERTSENTFLNNTTLNFPSLELSKSPKAATSSISVTNNKYLIVSVPKYSVAVNRFAEWKRTLGYDVQIEMRESWDTTMVRNVVHAACVPDTIDYLLIIGGHSDVPGVIRDKVFNKKHHYHPTDLYYGCLKSGYTPDIFRGRIPVSTANEAMTVVDKIINYEKNPVLVDSFYKKSVHCAYFQDRKSVNGQGDTIPPDGYEDRRFVYTSERIRDSLLSNTTLSNISRVYYTEDTITPTHWSRYYAHGEPIPAELTRPTFHWDGDSAGIADCINQKAFYVLMRDHGNVYRWGYPNFRKSDINRLQNGKFMPVIFSICCLTGKFDEIDCFCERFLKKEDGGCVAIFGATQSSLSGPNDVMAEGMFDAIWPSLNLQPAFGNIDSLHFSLTSSPTYRLGQILDQGLKMSDDAYSTVSGKTWYSQYTYELFHCFGDPSMMIYTEKPNTFSNASIIRQNNGTISVSTGGIPATITFYNRRTGEIVSYMGTSASHSGDSETSVCISAHNMVPYLDEGTLYIQNQTLADGGYYEAKNIKVGKNVTATQPQGNVNFSQGNYHLVGKNVELQSGTTVSVGTTMEIKNE